MFRKIIFILLCGFQSGNYLFAQNIAINISGNAAAATNMFEVTQTSTAANMVALYAIHNGATGAGLTGYGLQAIKTGATGTNVAGYFSATGGASNYAIIVPDASGSVGFGTSAPRVNYNFDVRGRSVFGNQRAAYTWVDDSLVILLHHNYTSTAASIRDGMVIETRLTPAANSAVTARGLNARIYLDGPNSFSSTLVGVNGVILNNGGSTGSLRGLYGEVYNMGAFTAAKGIGVYGFVSNNNAGGTITDAYSGYFNIRSNTAGGTITNAYGVYISDPLGAGNVTNNYGLYIEGQTKGNTLDYALYSNGGLSYFKDSVGIGTATPTAALHTFSSAALPLQVKAEQTNTTTLSQFVAVGENSNAIIYMRQGNSGLPGTTWANMPLSGSVVSGTSNSNGLILHSAHASAPIVFVTGGSTLAHEKMRLQANGTLKMTGTSISSPGIWMDGTVTAGAGTAYGILSRGTLTAAANNDAFIPFSNCIGTANTGTFTGLTFYGAQLDGASWSKTGTGTINNAYGLYVTTPTIATANYAAVFSGGHVGIGTTSPGAGLDIVYGGVVSSSASKILHSGTAALNPGTALRVSNGYPAAGGNYEVFGVYGNSFGTNYLSVVDNGRTYITAVNEQYGLGVKYVSTGGAVYFGAKSGVATPDAVISNAGGATLMTLQNAGNVGIGTTAPASRLEVTNTAGGYISSNYVQITGTTADNLNYPGLSMKGGTLATTYPSMSLTNGGLGAIIYSGTAAGFPNQMFGLFDAGGSFIQFGKVGSPYMTINSAGDVGIGTPTPSQKLEINGGVMLNTATAQPACAAGTRGLMWFIQGGAGVKDRCEVCAKDAANAYAWRVLY